MCTFNLKMDNAKIGNYPHHYCKYLNCKHAEDIFFLFLNQYNYIVSKNKDHCFSSRTRRTL